MIDLRNITKENYEECLALKVSENQMSFVAPNVKSLAQAWVFYRTAFPFAIYADNVLVGFIMMGFYEEKNCYTLWRFMIDEKHQNKGYGKIALSLAINYMIDSFGIKELFTSVVPENSAAKNLYNSLGFNETGELSGNEIVMKLLIDDFNNGYTK